ncbi:hypothetical protein BJ165DRAFT_1529853 [Panaeolus papilionaceus]|nr:hypothetical protein BJ165DRAFT_1529853 [Panaeolus papilionaceus]
MSRQRPPQRRLNRFDSWSEVEDSQDEESLENKRHQRHIDDSETDVSTHSGCETENEAERKIESDTNSDTEIESEGDTGSKTGGSKKLEDDDVEDTTQSSDGDLGNHTPDPEWHMIMQRRRQKIEARTLAGANTGMIINPDEDDDVSTTLADNVEGKEEAHQGKERGVAIGDALEAEMGNAEDVDPGSQEEVGAATVEINEDGEVQPTGDNGAGDNQETMTNTNNRRGREAAIEASQVTTLGNSRRQEGLVPSVTTGKKRKIIDMCQNCGDEIAATVKIKIRRLGSVNISVKRRHSR